MPINSLGYSCIKKLQRDNLWHAYNEPINFYSVPSTINIWKNVLTKAIWADRKWAGFWQISLYIKKNWNIKQNRNLDFSPEFSSWFRMFFRPENLKREKYNPWFKLWFDILMHTQSIMCVTVDSWCLEY